MYPTFWIVRAAGQIMQTTAPHALESWRLADKMEGKQASKLRPLANGGWRSMPTGTAKRDGRICRIMTAASNRYDCRLFPGAAGIILRGLENVRIEALEKLRGH